MSDTVLTQGYMARMDWDMGAPASAMTQYLARQTVRVLRRVM